MRTTDRQCVSVPRTTLNRARETFPETRDMSMGRLLRYTLAKALGATDAEALAATRDPRIGTTRKPQTTS